MSTYFSHDSEYFDPQSLVPSPRLERSQRRERTGKSNIQIQEAQKSGQLVAQAKEVTFGYGKQPVVDNFSTTIMRGDRIGVIGPNGVGKTTLIKLLAGLYTPQKGSITLDGLSLKEWDPTVLHQRIGVIFQDFLRYQFRVGENIGVGDLEKIEDREAWVHYM